MIPGLKKLKSIETSSSYKVNYREVLPLGQVKSVVKIIKRKTNF